MMARRCTVCTHTEREAIEAALLAGEPLRDIAGQRGVSKSALQRHQMEHIPAALAKAQEAQEAAHAIDLVKQLREVDATALSILAEARQGHDPDLALRAMDRIHKQLELQAKLLGQLDERPQVNILVSPEWIAIRTTLLTALAPYTEARVAVARALLQLEAGDGRGG